MPTLLGLCHNANFPDSTLTLDLARALRPARARTIVYKDARMRELVIANALDLQSIGITSYFQCNTEFFGGVIEDLTLHQAELRTFLDACKSAGLRGVTVSGGNEVDTPGWTTGAGAEITPNLIAQIGKRTADVVWDYRDLAYTCDSPSLLRGPSEGIFEVVAYRLARYGKTRAMAVHPYYCSIGGYPTPGWHFGTVEGKADECRSLGSGLPTCFEELGCPTRFEGIGQGNDASFAHAERHFRHDAILELFDFALTDRMVPRGELQEGKDWGLLTEDGVWKPAAYEFAKGQTDEPHGPHFVLGFATVAGIYPGLIGRPKENEFGPFPGLSLQECDGGTLFAANTIELGGWGIGLKELNGKRWRLYTDGRPATLIAA